MGNIPPEKGLDICEAFFYEHGRPMLEREFAGSVNKIAAGLVGDGSECYGFDDQYSQDHDWGPGFCLWIRRSDSHKLFEPLSRAYNSLPNEFLGAGPRKTSLFGQGRVGVFCIEDFYQGFTGLDFLPQTLDQWLAIPENSLAAATNGRVFCDFSGEFKLWRKRYLDFYPEDVRKKKLASRAMTIGQSGQYNFSRSVKRGDFVAAAYAQIKFVADAASMVHLLAKKYTPFYKWMQKSLMQLGGLGQQTAQKLEGLVLENNWAKKGQYIESVCADLVDELKTQGLTRRSSDFLADHGPSIQEGIADPDMAARNVWVG
jgi:hypothetical protein